MVWKDTKWCAKQLVSGEGKEVSAEHNSKECQERDRLASQSQTSSLTVNSSLQNPGLKNKRPASVEP